MKRVLKFFRPYLKYIVTALIFVFIGSLAEVMLPAVLSDVIEKGVITGDKAYVIGSSVKMIAIAIVSVLFSVIEGYFTNRTAVSAGRDMRMGMFKKVQELDQENFGEYGVSTLLVRTTNDIMLLEQISAFIIRIIFTAPIMIIAVSILAIRENVKMALILLVMMPLMVIIVSILGKKIQPDAIRQQERLDDVNRVIRENLTGVRVVRAFHNEDLEKDRFNKTSRSYADIAIKVQKSISILMPLFLLIVNLGTIVVAIVGANEVSAGAFGAGGVMQMIQYTTMIMMQLMMLSMIIVMSPRVIVSAKRVAEVLDTEIKILSPENPLTPKEEDRGKIEFKNVSFTFGESETPALSGLNFSVQRGQTLALIGGTGSGKTTILNMIPRMVDAGKNADGSVGEVLISGQNARDYDVETLRMKIAYVPQKATLFTGTIKENLLQGKEDASEEDLIRAAEISNALPFIEEKEHGFDEKVAEGGANFSGGQKQRLTIARGVIRDAEFYMFDDSFSALDFQTESKVRAEVKKLARKNDATLVIVGQRISTIMNADKILVMDEGKIVGQGTHKELLETCKVYKEIAHSQLTEEELAI